jgi:hypothetical protein
VCPLNHLNNYVLGSTKQGNISLWEDNIGLRAFCEITDAEVIKKQKMINFRAGLLDLSF